MKPPTDPTTPGLPRQYPTLEGLSNVPQAVKTSIRRAYQHIYDLRDEMLKRTADGGSGGCGGCTIFKGVVATEGDLPTTGNKTGDGWITEDTGHLWVWDSTTWVDAGSIMGPSGPAGPAGAPGAPGAPGPPGAPGAGSPAYISSMFAGPDTTRTISGATHGYATAGLLVAVYDNASPRNAIEAGWTVNASTYDVVVTFAAPQSNYYVVVNGATGMQGPPGSGGGSGTVTSVALTMPGEFLVSGSPVTTSGTLAVSKSTQSANTVFAGPTTGSAAAPTFRAVAPADLPLASSSAFGAVKVDGTTITASGGVISSAGGSAGALVLLEQHMASSSATLDFTTCITSAYDVYAIEVLSLVPATNNVAALLRFSTDGGSSYLTGSGYFWTNWVQNISGTYGGTVASNGQAGTDAIVLWGDSTRNGMPTGAAPGLSCSFRLYDPLNTSVWKLVRGDGIGRYNTPATYVFDFGGINTGTTAVNAFRILMSSGNIASGIVRVYGLAK